MAFPPMAQGLAFPLLILWNHAPSQFSCSEHSRLGYLIKMHIYTMSQFNICHISQYTISDHSNPKNNITKSMVGPLPLAPHHDYLQHMLACIFNASGSKPGVLQSPPPWNNTILGVPIHIQFAHPNFKIVLDLPHVQDQAPRLP